MELHRSDRLIRETRSHPNATCEKHSTILTATSVSLSWPQPVERKCYPFAYFEPWRKKLNFSTSHRRSRISLTCRKSTTLLIISTRSEVLRPFNRASQSVGLAAMASRSAYHNQSKTSISLRPSILLLPSLVLPSAPALVEGNMTSPRSKCRTTISPTATDMS